MVFPRVLASIVSLAVLVIPILAVPIEARAEIHPDCKLFTGPAAKFVNALKPGIGQLFYSNKEIFWAVWPEPKNIVKLKGGKSAKGKAVMGVTVSRIDSGTEEFIWQKTFRYEVTDGAWCIARLPKIDHHETFHSVWVEDSIQYPDGNQ